MKKRCLWGGRKILLSRRQLFLQFYKYKKGAGLSPFQRATQKYVILNIYVIYMYLECTEYDLCNMFTLFLTTLKSILVKVHHLNYRIYAKEGEEQKDNTIVSCFDQSRPACAHTQGGVSKYKHSL